MSTTPVTGALLLSAVAVVLGGLTVLGARRPSASVPDRDGFYDRWSQLHGGYDPRASTWVRGWLALTFRAAVPLARRGVQPDVLSAWSVWFACAVLVLALQGGRWPIVAGVALVASGAVDSLDGAVAALTARATRWGQVLDSFADRLSDGLFLVAVWVVGAFAWLAVAVGVAIALLEYLRARAGSAGMSELGVVTVAERPTRVICCAGALLSAGAVTEHAVVLASAWLAVLGGLTLIGLAQLLVAVRRALR